MRNSSVKAIVVLIGVMMVAVLMTGCEQQSASDTKKGRLLAVENQQLTELLEKCSEELNNQKALLAECQTEKSTEIKKTREDLKTLVDFAMEQNKQLIAENQQLKARIEELQK